MGQHGNHPLPKTDEELVEERAQAQFKAILENKKESEIRDRVVARIHELAQAAGLKPQTEDELLKTLILQNVEEMRREHLAELAGKMARREFAHWQQQQNKAKKEGK